VFGIFAIGAAVVSMFFVGVLFYGIIASLLG